MLVYLSADIAIIIVERSIFINVLKNKNILKIKNLDMNIAFKRVAIYYVKEYGHTSYYLFIKVLKN